MLFSSNKAFYINRKKQLRPWLRNNNNNNYKYLISLYGIWLESCKPNASKFQNISKAINIKYNNSMVGVVAYFKKYNPNFDELYKGDKNK